MKIVVLCGGISTERNVSIKSGNLVYESLKSKGHEVILLDICQDVNVIPENIFSENNIFGKFDDSAICSEAPDICALNEIKEKLNGKLFGKNILEICKKADIVFMALHGADGENGKVQKLFSDEGIKYTGSDFNGSKNAMDKAITKNLLNVDGRVKTPFGKVIEYEVLQEIDKNMYNLKFPLVLKPCNGGSSVGVSIINDMDEYEKIINGGVDKEDSYILEQYIKGREFSVGVLAGKALPVIEIIPKVGFYDYKNKYKAGCTEEICPANIAKKLSEKMMRAAETVHDVLDLKVYSRVDFILSDDGELYCLEANTLPGMTPTSLLPQEAKVIGLSHADLCQKIIDLSLNKGE